MQYSASQVAIMAVFLSQNGLRRNLRACNFKKFAGGACPQTPLLLHACANYIPGYTVTPLLKILATGLYITIECYFTIYNNR